MNRWMISIVGIVIYSMFVFLSTGLAQDPFYKVTGPADPQEGSSTNRINILKQPFFASGSDKHVVTFNMPIPMCGGFLEYKTKNLDDVRAVYAGLLTVLNNKELAVVTKWQSNSCVKRRLVDPRTQQPIPGRGEEIFCSNCQAVSFQFREASTK